MATIRPRFSGRPSLLFALILCLTPLSSHGNASVLEVVHPSSGINVAENAPISVELKLDPSVCAAAAAAAAADAAEEPIVRLLFTRSSTLLRHVCSYFVKAGDGEFRWTHPPITLGDLSRGFHVLRAELLLNSAVAAAAKSRFFVGERSYVGRDDARSVYYSIHPLELLTRASVMRRHGFLKEAREDEMVVKGVKERWSEYPEGTPACVEGRYVSFREPSLGLNNMILELVSFVAIARALRRILVLPRLPSHAPSENNAVGETFLKFEDIFDSHHLITTLRDFVCISDQDMPSSPPEPTAVVHHAADENALVWYVDNHGSNEAAWLHFERPPGLSHYPLSLQQKPLPAYERRLLLSGSLRFNARIRSISGLIENRLRQSNAGYSAIHLRVEQDWKRHCEREEIAHGGRSLNVFCVGAEAIARAVASSRDELGDSFSVVYLAFGEDLLDRSDPHPLAVFSRVLPSTTELLTQYSASLEMDLGPLDGIPYLIQSAVDFAVCAAADTFVGNSWSTFSKHIAMLLSNTQSGKAVQKKSFLYNLLKDDTFFRRARGEGKDDGAIVLARRTDGGSLFEPHDATMALQSEDPCARLHLRWIHPNDRSVLIAARSITEKDMAVCDIACSSSPSAAVINMQLIAFDPTTGQDASELHCHARKIKLSFDGERHPAAVRSLSDFARVGTRRKTSLGATVPEQAEGGVVMTVTKQGSHIANACFIGDDCDEGSASVAFEVLPDPMEAMCTHFDDEHTDRRGSEEQCNGRADRRAGVGETYYGEPPLKSVRVVFVTDSNGVFDGMKHVLLHQMRALIDSSAYGNENAEPALFEPIVLDTTCKVEEDIEDGEFFSAVAALNVRIVRLCVAITPESWAGGYEGFLSDTATQLAALSFRRGATAVTAAPLRNFVAFCDRNPRCCHRSATVSVASADASATAGTFACEWPAPLSLLPESWRRPDFAALLHFFGGEKGLSGTSSVVVTANANVRGVRFVLELARLAGVARRIVDLGALGANCESVQDLAPLLIPAFPAASNETAASEITSPSQFTLSRVTTLMAKRGVPISVDSNDAGCVLDESIPATVLPPTIDEMIWNSSFCNKTFHLNDNFGGVTGVYIGRLAPQKGVGVLLRAIAALGSGNVRQQLRLLIVGDGKLRVGLMALASRLGLLAPPAVVRFVGALAHSHVVGCVLSHSKVQFLAFPSVFPESFGIVVAEALAAGLPVVGFGVGGSGALLRDLRPQSRGKIGAVVAANLTVDGYAAALRTMIEAVATSSVDERAAFAKRAQAMVYGTHSVAVTREQVRRFYRPQTIQVTHKT